MKDKISHKSSLAKIFIIALTLSTTLSSCTPEKRTMLRLTAETFRNQAVEAIASVKKIYQLNDLPLEPEISRDFVVEQLLSDRRINFGDPREVDKIITGENQSNNQPSDLERELDALQSEYDTAIEIFNNLETIDYGSVKIVAQTAQPARCLTVKMLLLAKQIQQKPPKPNNPQRVLIGLKLQQLQRKYNNPNTYSQIGPEEIKRQVAEQIDAWLKVNAAEQQILNESISRLLIAADTGRKLSKLIDEYPSLSFEAIATRITKIVGVANTVTGRDYSSILSRINSIEQSINADKTLQGFFQEVSQNNLRSQPLKSQLCQN
ncbi:MULTISPECIES: hypothetical protein [unclassified Tolypothrix]|uniref:hypothetical protein n=1 Tax=unclassified Tolypothrix TaxID=2649714 RepID=UPI0005EAAACF|nr:MULTISPECIES: hypothetical protein [unclassified Tolypothrix]EKE97584.1 hypothetical protein FDUTEX481_04962 [Tolypothrix sp. PCC 7601]BAY89707.1 hypothetical protein NIES3275_17100 [Microchaete diplosiphon NIES-3275]